MHIPVIKISYYLFQVNYGKGNLATINNDMIKGSLKVSGCLFVCLSVMCVEASRVTICCLLFSAWIKS